MITISILLGVIAYFCTNTIISVLLWQFEEDKPLLNRILTCMIVFFIGLPLVLIFCIVAFFYKLWKVIDKYFSIYAIVVYIILKKKLSSFEGYNEEAAIEHSRFFVKQYENPKWYEINKFIGRWAIRKINQINQIVV